MEDWMFRHLPKFVFAIIIVCVLFFVVQIGFAIFIGNEIHDKGLKHVVECIWEGGDKCE